MPSPTAPAKSGLARIHFHGDYLSGLGPTTVPSPDAYSMARQSQVCHLVSSTVSRHPKAGTPELRRAQLNYFRIHREKR